MSLQVAERPMACGRMQVCWRPPALGMARAGEALAEAPPAFWKAPVDIAAGGMAGAALAQTGMLETARL